MAGASLAPCSSIIMTGGGILRAFNMCVPGGWVLPPCMTADTWGSDVSCVGCGKPLLFVRALTMGYGELLWLWTAIAVRYSELLVVACSHYVLWLLVSVACGLPIQ